MPNIRWLLALVTAVHRFLYRVSGGQIGASLGGTRILLLENTGRKTGRKRITPLLYVRDGESWVVVASNAGDDRHPAWWLNLKSRPQAEVQIQRDRFPVQARQASADETQRLWPRLVEAYRYYDDYRQRTRREIPVVILEPAGEPSTSGELSADVSASGDR